MSKVIYKTEYMQSILQYIENNISSDLKTKFLSNIGYVSRDKLYYDFYNMSGHSVKEYIRKRRLSNALAFIKTSDMGLTDIAFQCGYSSHQALCRAVRQTLGLTPSEYKNSDTYYFFPPFNGELLQSVTVKDETIPDTLCILFYHSRLKNIESIALTTFLQVFPDYEGQIFGRNGKQEGSRFCYELYLTDINKNYELLTAYGFVITKVIPCFMSTFAASTVWNDEQKINAAWDYLYSQWLQTSMFEYTGEPYYEEYILKNSKPAKLKLRLPIQKRCEETKITLINNPELCFIAAKAKGYNAEEIASQTVIDYLTEHHPHIINTSKDLYLLKDINTCTCGIRINSELQPIKDENIIKIATNQNKYLVLTSSVMGDYDRYADLLFLFAYDNGMDADKKEIFAVYDGSESFNNLKIKMYCPIKIRTK